MTSTVVARVLALSLYFASKFKSGEELVGQKQLIMWKCQLCRHARPG